MELVLYHCGTGHVGCSQVSVGGSEVKYHISLSFSTTFGDEGRHTP